MPVIVEEFIGLLVYGYYLAFSTIAEGWSSIAPLKGCSLLDRWYLGGQALQNCHFYIVSPHHLWQ
jgi:hypothetical protein